MIRAEWEHVTPPPPGTTIRMVTNTAELMDEQLLPDLQRLDERLARLEQRVDALAERVEELAAAWERILEKLESKKK